MILEHKHLIIRAEVTNPPTDQKWAEQWIEELIVKIGMIKCAGPISAYVNVVGNKGLTIAAIIESSHIVMHVWDEPNPSLIQFDVYTCGPLDTNIVFNELKQFDIIKLEYKYLDRECGLQEISLT
jgi:S-adenosylmethionine/arginine decarboxylase-like enzyme